MSCMRTNSRCHFHINILLGWQQIFGVFFDFSSIVKKVLEVSILSVYIENVNVSRIIVKESIWRLTTN